MWPRNQDWWDMASTARWRQEHVPSPFKHNRVPYFILPRGKEPQSYLPDTCHTFHIGFGVDMAASMVVCLCRLALFEGVNHTQKLDTQQALAFRRYVEWCNRSHRYTSCREWSEKVLGVRLGSESICMESERQHAHVYDSICIPVCIYVDIRNDRIWLNIIKTAYNNII